MLDVIECIWNKRIKVTLNFEVGGELRAGHNCEVNSKR